LQALGAKDENEALRNAMDSTKLLTDLVSATGAKNVDEALAVVRSNAKLIGSLETVTGKKGDESLGAVQAWKGSHEALPAVQTQLTEATGKLETFEIETMISKAKNECKLDKSGEDKLRAKLQSGEFTIATARGALEFAHPIAALVNAKALQQPAVLPENLREAPPVSTAAGYDPSKKYEDYTPDEMGSLRQSGAIDKNTYATMRQQWIADGRPTVKTKAA